MQFYIALKYYNIPFQPKKLRDFASQFIAIDKYSKTLPRIDNGQVPNKTTKTIIKITSKMFFTFYLCKIFIIYFFLLEQNSQV